MFRDRLLTWLFITASVVVDLALLAAVMASPNPHRYEALQEGLAAGQVGALAIWAITGSAHRLARVAGLVISTGLLTLLVVGQEIERFGEPLVLLAIYAAIVLAAVGVIAACRRAFSGKRESVRETFQVSLIEMFGWMIVVAIASFGARFMDLQVLDFYRSHSAGPLVLLLSVPVIAELLFRPKFQPLQLVKWMLFVGSFYVAGGMFADQRLLANLFATQAAYLAAWMVVRSLESDEPGARERGNVAAASEAK
jgi:hypothetical protein